MVVVIQGFGPIPDCSVPDVLNMWILNLLCQGSFMLNFIVICDIHFTIIFVLNDIIGFLFQMFNTLVLYLPGIVRTNAGDWRWGKMLIGRGTKTIFRKFIPWSSHSGSLAIFLRRESSCFIVANRQHLFSSFQEGKTLGFWTSGRGYQLCHWGRKWW